MVKKIQGFTLIELLIVVAIIGILATVVLASLGEARTRTQQKKWLNSVSVMQRALELHHANTGTYPSSFEYYPSNPTYDGNLDNFTLQMNDYINVSEFIASIPEGLSTLIYYGYYADGVGGTTERCPDQEAGQAGQTYAITFDTQDIDIIDTSWHYNTFVGASTYEFYCAHS